MVLALPLASAQMLAALLLLALAGLAAYLGVRQAARLAAARLLARATDDSGGMDITAAERAKRIRTLQALTVRVAGVVILITVALMVLDAFNINIGPAVAGLGVAGIAIGLGAQTLVRDWLAGIFILSENQFSRGDVVRIAGVSGVVEELSLRRTVLRDLDGVVHSVPNGQITVASNLTRLFARVNLDVQVAYGTDIDQVSSAIDGVGRALAADLGAADHRGAVGAACRCPHRRGADPEDRGARTGR
jgi:small conductance mechanosensitive channel